MSLSICTAQLNYIVGDLAGNTQKILAAAEQAYAQGARVLLTPELALCAYAAEDLGTVAPDIVMLAEAEGLNAHAQAISLRRVRNV